MRWPPWAADSSKESSYERKPVSWADTLNATNWDEYKEPRTLVPTLLLTTTILGSFAFYRSYLRRIPGAGYIKPNAFGKRSLFGTVTRVGDGDNFHLFHTPGGRLAGWGWLRKIPNWTPKQRRTVAIRIAGIDAPEAAHFGNGAQPYSAEALDWLQKYLMNQRVRAHVYRRDQYGRIVASVKIRRWFFRKDVGLEMIKSGLATVYEAKTGSEFGNLEQVYRDAEAKARLQRKGMWSSSSGKFESPRDYKTRMAAVEAAKATKGSAPKSTTGGFFSKLFGL